MNNFVVEVWKKFDLDTDLVRYAKTFFCKFIPLFHEQIEVRD
jgi:hypothetical protein